MIWELQTFVMEDEQGTLGEGVRLCWEQRKVKSYCRKLYIDWSSRFQIDKILGNKTNMG